MRVGLSSLSCSRSWPSLDTRDTRRRGISVPMTRPLGLRTVRSFPRLGTVPMIAVEVRTPNGLPLGAVTRSGHLARRARPARRGCTEYVQSVGNTSQPPQGIMDCAPVRARKLRPRERGRRRAAERRDELAPIYSITSSAHANTTGASRSGLPIRIVARR